MNFIPFVRPNRVLLRKFLAFIIVLSMLTPGAYCFENTEEAPAASDVSLNEEPQVVDETSVQEEEADESAKETESEESLEEAPVEEAQIESSASTSSVPLGATDYMKDAMDHLNPNMESDQNYFDTSLFTGSFAYTYPVDTIRGVGGLEPDVSISYSSSAGAKGIYGSLGSGWSLNENCVVRDTRYTPDNTNDDEFVLYVGGSSYKLIYVSAEDTYHTEIETFINISRKATSDNAYGEYWLVKLPDGTNYKFGSNNDSEQVNSVDSRNYVSKWWLDSVEDVNGNTIHYNYVENPTTGDAGSTYLHNITYNNNLSVIGFELKTKPDYFVLYEYGNKISEKSMISNITVQHNETILWKYKLNYQDTNSRVYLSSITKTGNNGAAYPSTVFTYDSVTGWEQNNSWIPPLEAYPNEGERLADVNGDGLTDLVKGYKNSQGTESYDAWINNGTGWEQDTSWRLPTYFSDNGADAGVHFADVNGDGLADVIKGNSSRDAWINNGTGWVQNSTWTPPVEFYDDSRTRLSDVNGDGLIDIVSAYNNGTEHYDAWINNGTGWEQNNSWNPPTYFFQSGSTIAVQLADVNGDGLVDVIKSEDTSKDAWLNNGTGWEQNSTWNPPIAFNSDGRIRLSDVNGDGLVDIVSGYHDGSSANYDAWINNGTGWEQDNSWNPPTYFSKSGTTTAVQLTDVNGDGLADVVKSNSAEQSAAWIHTNNNASTEGYHTPGLLKEIKHSSGAVTTVKYSPSTKSDNTGSDDVSDLPFNMWIVSQLVRNNGMSGSDSTIATTNYTYKNGMQFFNPPVKTEFRGFGEVVVEKEFATVKHLFHQDAVLKGIENHTELWDTNGNIYTVSDMEYNYLQPHTGVNLVLLESESSTKYDGLAQIPNASKGWTSSTEYTKYDNYGNPLSVVDYGDVDIQGDERYYEYEYASDVDSWILGKTTNELMNDSSGNKKGESWYYYDNSDNSNLDKGLLTKIVTWNDMGDNPVELYAYDNYGNVINITNPRGYSELIGYDENNLYPVSITNALGQQESYEYNELGRITKITDSNGISTEYAYDDLYRISKVIKPFDTASSPSIEYTYYLDGVAPEKVSVDVKEMEGDEDTENTSSNESNGLPGFNNSKTITITPSADGTLIDYQLQVMISYESEMQSDFEDLRFTDENANLLSYWIEEKTDSSSSKVWVKVPVIDGTDNTTITMYYGNSTVSSLSDGSSVFEFFDGFEGSALDSEVWTANQLSGGSYSVSNGVLYINNPVEIFSINTLENPGALVLESRARMDNHNYGDCWIGFSESDKSNASYVRHYRQSRYYTYAIGNSIATSNRWADISGIEGSYHNWKVVWESNTSSTASLNGGNEHNVTSNVPSGPLNIGMYTRMDTVSDHDSKLWMDWIFVRKYAADEPNVSIGVDLDCFNPSDFSRSKMISISPSSDGTLNDYQMQFNISYESEMQTDFDDLRFTNETGTLLPYWIEDLNDSSYARVWVKIPVIDESSNTAITMYYGNSVASSLSSGSSVFEFFDNFEDSTIGTTGNWSLEKTGSFNSGQYIRVILDDTGDNTNVIDVYTNQQDAWAGWYYTWARKGLSIPTGDYIFECDSRTSRTDSTYWKTSIQVNDVSKYQAAPANTSWIHYSYNILDSSITSLRLGQYTKQHSATHSVRFDNVFIRKYTENEPIYTIGTNPFEDIISTTSFMSIEYYNGFGQLAQKKIEGENDWIYQTTTYNELGLEEKVEVPHYMSENTLFVEYEYDTAGRVTKITNTDGNTISFDYDLSNTTATNENGFNRTIKSDIYGNFVTVYEFNEGETYVTDYYYDALDNLVSIQPHSDGVRMPDSVNFTYDSLGRKVAMSDPDMGNWSYEYDLNGNLVNQTDAKGVSTLLTYDSLDRVTTIDYLTDSDISFTYDTDYNGTLSEVSLGFSSSSYDYDSRYRVTNESRTFNTTSYNTSYEYDVMDRVTRITYPDGGSVNLTYNNQTLLKSIEGVVDDIDYNSRNQITRKKYSNGVVTNYTYDSQKMLLERIYAADLQDLEYEFDNVGNILEIQDDLLNSVKSFEYDDLDRLTGAEMAVTGVPIYQRDYTYDRYGCIMEVKDRSNQTYYRMLNISDTYAGNNTLIQINDSLAMGMDSNYSNVEFRDLSGNILIQDRDFDWNNNTVRLNCNTSSGSTSLYQYWGPGISAKDFNIEESVIELPYYLTSATDGFIKTNLTASKTKTVYLEKKEGYSPDGKQVFEYFDDFEDSTIGTTGNWSLEKTGSFNSGQYIRVILDDTGDNTNVMDVYSHQSGSWAGWYYTWARKSLSLPTGDYIVECDSRTLRTNPTYWKTSIQVNDISKYQAAPANTNWIHYSYNILDSSITSLRLGQYAKQYSATHSVRFDNVSIRKYASTEPSVTISDLGNGVYKAEIVSTVNLTDYQVPVNFTNLSLSSTAESLYVIEKTLQTSPVTFGSTQNISAYGPETFAYEYGSTPFHAPSKYNGYNLTYDQNGNLLQDEYFTYVYNNANMLSEVRHFGNSSLVERYWYDENGERIQKENADGEFTYYVNSFYEIENGTATSYYFRDGERVAKKTADVMEWYLSDHLGSTSLMVDENGTEIERSEYFPYGAIESGGSEKYGFTGQENDVDTGLMYYGARYYSPEVRVFTQPDTMIPDPYNPQTLNRYAYALNNPLKYTDPSGNLPIIPIIMVGMTIWSMYTAHQNYEAWRAGDMSTGSFVIQTGLEFLPSTKALKIAKGAWTVGKITKKAFKPAEIKNAAVATKNGIQAGRESAHHVYDTVITDRNPMAIYTEIKTDLGNQIKDNSDELILTGIVDGHIKGVQKLYAWGEEKHSSGGSIRASVSNRINSASKSVSDTVSSVSNSVRSSVSSASKSISNAVSSVKKSYKSAKRSVRKFISRWF
ncbi:RHS repeat-associated protein [Methanohalophilus levihalophilus]|uniref:DUF2341 domain-containing protein n=1 Tax=Methanohalophilus levihalophilus TaxID=1431282 RepID=UPI001AE822B5|nr:DUF2341 domain-containing protein [Methanohalophilus levihalophilus]MBP2029401.1 RHS repeat-associated protein [Methanohalophilus levihalophilus]